MFLLSDIGVGYYNQVLNYTMHVVYKLEIPCANCSQEVNTILFSIGSFSNNCLLLGKSQLYDPKKKNLVSDEIQRCKA